MGHTIVDAHNVSGVNIDQAIEGVCKALPIAMPLEELCLRRQLADKLLITMGNGMTHFEGDIDSATGTVKVDFTFTPIVVDPKKEEHLRHLHEYDPSEERFKVMNCAIARLYATQVDPETGRKFPYLIASQPIDIEKLHEQSIRVTEAAIDCTRSSSAAALTTGEAIALAEKYPVEKHPSAMLTSSEYDFPMRHNFCNTFALVRVLPFVGKVVSASSETEAAQISGNKHAMQVHAGLYATHSLSHDAMHEELCSMKAELQAMKDGIAKYEEHRKSCEEKGIAVNLSEHIFVSSILHKVPYIQSMVKLQQALQQAYCMNFVQTASALMSEPNSMAFASGATFLQSHQMSMNFAIMTQAHDDRGVPIPRQQLMLQCWAAMAKSCLDFKDVSQWKASTHAQEIGSLISSIISMSNMDQVCAHCSNVMTLFKCNQRNCARLTLLSTGLALTFSITPK